MALVLVEECFYREKSLRWEGEKSGNPEATLGVMVSNRYDTVIFLGRKGVGRYCRKTEKDAGVCLGQDFGDGVVVCTE